MSFSLLSISLLLFFLIITAIEIYRYVNKGIERSLLAFGSSIMSLILSIVISPAISGAIVSVVYSLFVKNIEVFASLSEQFPSIDMVIFAVLTSLLNTFIFIIMFFIFRRIIRMIISIIYNSAAKTKKSDPGYAKDKEAWYKKSGKIISGVVGGLSGFMICLIFTSPLIGSAQTLDKIGDIVETSQPGTLDSYAIAGGERISSIKSDLGYITNDVVGNTFYQLGGKHIYNASTCADVEYNRVYLSNELDATKLIISDFKTITKSLEDGSPLGQEDVEVLYALGDHIQEVEIVHYIAADALSTCSTAWLDGNLFMGMEKPRLHSAVDGAIDEVLAACAQTDEKSVKPNLNTLIRLYAIIIESEIMNVDASNYTDLISFVDQSGIIDKVNEELAANPYMTELSISSIAMSAIADSISIEAIGVENYNTLMNNIANAIETVNSRGYGSNEEKVEVLTTYAQKYISEYDLDVPDSIAEVVAQELLNVLESSETGSVTAQDISDLINRYQ